MAGFGFPSQPVAPTAGAVRPAAPSEQHAPQNNQFAKLMQSPEVKAALLQFGISMLNPRSGNTLAEIGRSLGQGAAAAGRVPMIQQQREQESLKAQREAEKHEFERRRVETTEAGERRRSKMAGTKGGSKGLTSMFSKTPSLTAFMRDASKAAAEHDSQWGDVDNPKTFLDFENDPEWRAKVEQSYRASINGSSADTGAASSAPAPSGPAAGGIPSPKSMEEYNALPSGTVFINPADGRKMRKP